MPTNRATIGENHTYHLLQVELYFCGVEREVRAVLSESN